MLQATREVVEFCTGKRPCFDTILQRIPIKFRFKSLCPWQENHNKSVEDEVIRAILLLSLFHPNVVVHISAVHLKKTVVYAMAFGMYTVEPNCDDYYNNLENL